MLGTGWYFTSHRQFWTYCYSLQGKFLKGKWSELSFSYKESAKTLPLSPRTDHANVERVEHPYLVQDPLFVAGMLTTRLSGPHIVYHQNQVLYVSSKSSTLKPILRKEIYRKTFDFKTKKDFVICHNVKPDIGYIFLRLIRYN